MMMFGFGPAPTAAAMLKPAHAARIVAVCTAVLLPKLLIVSGRTSSRRCGATVCLSGVSPTRSAQLGQLPSRKQVRGPKNSQFHDYR
eukprot:COSAG02_NODE_2557_length_8529_cov_7.615658_5_plen_87_part_00